MLNFNLTKHAQNDRYNRLIYIRDTVGIGDVVMAQVRDNDGTSRYLTDTGVILVISQTATLITAWIATTTQALVLYKTAHNGAQLPNYLYKCITRNQRFTVNQPQG